MSENLWAVAASRLTEKDKAYIDLDTTVQLVDVLSSVNDKRRECEAKRWAVKHVILRDLFKKIAVWIEKFVAVGDVAVAHDPGHAALPWAAVRFLLIVSVKDVQQYAVVLEGIERVSHIVTYYKIVEQLFIRDNSDAASRLKDAVTNLYVSILIFLVKAKRFYLKSTASRALKSFTDFSNKFSGYINNVSKEEAIVRSYMILVRHELSHSIESELRSLSTEEESRSRRLVKILDDLQIRERTEILQWLSPIPYIQHHTQARKGVLPGTGRWLLTDQKLLEWRVSSTSSIIWLSSPPGFGKTRLVSILIEQLIGEFEKGENPHPIYFYCTRDPSEPERSQPEAILRSLVRQMACVEPTNVVSDPARKVYQERSLDGFAAGSLTLAESTSLLVELCSHRHLTTIVIDALDECDPESRSELLDALSTILENSKELIKIFVSSREERDIICHLEGRVNLQVEARNNEADIVQFVDVEVDRLIRTKRLLSGKVPQDLRQQIKEVLRDQAHGMFRWVSLQLQYLAGLKLEAAVRRRLGKLPQKLQKIYEDTYVQRLELCEDEERHIAESTFRLLLGLRTPLKTDDFLLALRYCSGEDIKLTFEELLDLCFNFVTHDKELDRFRFTHLSVQEFLTGKMHYAVERNHALIATCCLRYLTAEDVLVRRSSSDSRSDDPALPAGSEVVSAPVLAVRGFLEYACFFWPHHLSQSKEYRLEDPLKHVTLAFMMDDQADTSKAFAQWLSNIFNLWTNLRKSISRMKLGRAGFWYSRYTGKRLLPTWNVREYIDKKYEKMFSAIYSEPANYVFSASIFGFPDVLRIALDARPSLLHARNWEHNGLLGLACIFSNGSELLVSQHEGVVSLLLEKQADPNTREVYGLFRKRYEYEQGSLIHLAVTNSRPAIVRLLLKFGADLDVRNEGHDSPLDLAMVCGRVDMVKVLVEHSGGSEHDFDYFIRVTRVLEAARFADEARMLRLLDELPDHRRSNRDLGRALWRAVASGNIDPVRALLSKGADPRTTYRDSCVLYFASKNYAIPEERSRPLVDLLKEHGAEPDDMEEPADQCSCCHDYRTYRTTTTRKEKWKKQMMIMKTQQTHLTRLRKRKALSTASIPIAAS